jgi:hypothetical protein
MGKRDFAISDFSRFDGGLGVSATNDVPFHGANFR